MRKLVLFADRGGFWNIAFMGGLVTLVSHFAGPYEVGIAVGLCIAAPAVLIDFMCGFAPRDEES